MTAWWRHQGDAGHPTRVSRLMRVMGLEAISPQPRLRQPGVGHESDPDRLRGVTVDRVNQVWSADSTDIRLQFGLVYLVAVWDWCGRSVLSWAVSITGDVLWCLEALEQAWSWGRPEVFNTDPGAQLTRQELTARRQKGEVRIRMDGRGRALAHVFVERLWRSVQYEEVYVREYPSVWDARHRLAPYFGGITRHGSSRR